jgi:rhodanese-related sulfurtransferase
MKLVGIIVVILIGAGLLLVREPSLETKLARIEPDLNAKLKGRQVQIDSAELVDLTYNFNTGLRIIDVRDEAEYNLFHIMDAQHATLAEFRDSEWVKRLPEETVFVLVSNDEKRATEAWKLLSAQGVLNLYILEGGINYWLDLYDPKTETLSQEKSPAPRPKGDDTLRHKFTAALGSRHPAADPDPQEIPEREYTKKVKPIGRAPKKSGGCG